MRKRSLSAVSGLIALTAASAATAQSSGSIPASQIPDLVVPPNGINLGSTSFYDGLSTLKPGVTLLQYVRYNHLDSITDRHGNDAAAFTDPRIDVATTVTQFSIASPVTFDGNVLGFDVLIPVTAINSRFGRGGMALGDNGTNLGDITFGPFIQFKPIMQGRRPLASIRVALDAIAPTGGFNRSRDLNQGSGYWSINPYVAWTILPVPGWEISGRTQYLYSFKTSSIANPPTIPGFNFNDGQAGQLLYSNIAASRDFARGVSMGLNGFVVQQLNADRINDIRLPDTRRSAVYLGPGLHLDRLPRWGLNANLYLPVTTRNYATGPQFNLQFILPIR